MGLFGYNEANNFFFIEMEHNMFKNPNWQGVNQLAILQA